MAYFVPGMDSPSISDNYKQRAVIDSSVDNWENRQTETAVSTKPSNLFFYGRIAGVKKVIGGAVQTVVGAGVLLESFAPISFESDGREQSRKFGWTHFTNGVGNVVAGALETTLGPIVGYARDKLQKRNESADRLHLYNKASANKLISYSTLPYDITPLAPGQKREWRILGPKDQVARVARKFENKSDLRSTAEERRNLCKKAIKEVKKELKQSNKSAKSTFSLFRHLCEGTQ